MCDKCEAKCCERPTCVERKQPVFKVGGLIDEKFYNKELNVYAITGITGNDNDVLLSKSKYIEFETTNLYRLRNAIEEGFINFVAIFKVQ
jgi:hypothetical protein